MRKDPGGGRRRGGYHHWRVSTIFCPTRSGPTLIGARTFLPGTLSGLIPTLSNSDEVRI